MGCWANDTPVGPTVRIAHAANTAGTPRRQIAIEMIFAASAMATLSLSMESYNLNATAP